MGKLVKGVVMFALVVVVASGCGGGGGGVAPSNTPVVVTPTYTNIDTSQYTNQPETVTSDYKVSGIPQPTDKEEENMNSLDNSISSRCSVLNPNKYKRYLDSIVSFYNEIRTDASWGAVTNNLPAEVMVSKSQRREDIFNVFECGGDVLNKDLASAGYRNVYVWDGFIQTVDEIVDLLFFSKYMSESVYNNNLNLILYNASQGKHFKVITESLHMSLRNDPVYGPLAEEVFIEVLAFSISHEIGHLTMAHILQDIRSNFNDDFRKGHEHQSDIFASAFLKIAGGDISNSYLTMYIVDVILTYQHTNPIPSIPERRYVISLFDSGAITVASLTPLYPYARVQSYARTIVRQKGFDIRKPLLPE